MNSIKVSVIIPTYSRNDTLDRAIQSVLNQTHKNVEIVVVDDNPADSEWRKKTEKLMSRYHDIDKIKYVQNKKNLGGAGSRNVGIENSSSDYLAFLDDDDIYMPEKIEKQLAVFMNSGDPNLAMVYCWAAYLGANGKIGHAKQKAFNGNCLFEAMKYDCIAATSQWMVKKELLANVGNFSIVPSQQDSTVIIKLLSAGYTIHCIPEELSIYDCVLDQRISMGNKRNIEGRLLFSELCRNNYSSFTKKQIDEVEFTINSKLYFLYKNNDLEADEKRTFNTLCSINILKTVYLILENSIERYKSVLKKVLFYSKC